MKKTDVFFIIIASLLIAFFLVSKTEVNTYVDIQYVHLDSPEKIIDITDSLVQPVLYDSLIIRSFISTEERKKQFVNQVLPAILVVRYQMENKSKKVRKIIKKIEEGEILKPKEQTFVDSLMVKYRAKSHENLLLRLKPHPVSLVLAQAAVESGWGSSRFAVEGNNLFGIWTTPGDPNVIKSMYNREDQTIFLKKYKNIAESVDHYFLTIGRHKAYRSFRTKRYEEVDVFALIDELNKYSEKGEEYTSLLKKMIEWNNFQKYDRYQIDPKYIIVETWGDKILEKIKKRNI